MGSIDELQLVYPFTGARVLRDQLNRAGHVVGRKRVGTLMKESPSQDGPPLPPVRSRRGDWGRPGRTGSPGRLTLCRSWSRIATAAAHGKAFLQFSGKDEHGFDLPYRGGGYRAGVRIADVLEAVKLTKRFGQAADCLRQPAFQGRDQVVQGMVVGQAEIGRAHV